VKLGHTERLPNLKLDPEEVIPDLAGDFTIVSAMKWFNRTAQAFTPGFGRHKGLAMKAVVSKRLFSFTCHSQILDNKWVELVNNRVVVRSVVPIK